MKNLRKTVSQFLFAFVALFIAAGCFAMLFAPPESRAEVIGRDKYLHAGGSAVLGAVARSKIEDPWKAWQFAMVPGLMKEMYDMRKGGSGFSVRDLIADGVGAYVGVKLGGLIFTPGRVTYSRTF